MPDINLRNYPTKGPAFLGPKTLLARAEAGYPSFMSARAWTFAVAVTVALTAGVWSRRAAPPPEDMRDAVASPASSASEQGWLATPSVRRAEAERALTASREAKIAAANKARRARLRREAALAVSAQ